jgi:hypothetical protein
VKSPDAQIRRLRAKARAAEKHADEVRTKLWDWQGRAQKAEQALRPFADATICAVENFGFIGEFFDNGHVATMRQRPLFADYMKAAEVLYPKAKLRKT